MTPKDIHYLLLQEAVRQGLPQHYKDDLLVHDLNMLEGSPDMQRFIWVLRDCGTHLVRADAKEPKDRAENRYHAKAISKTFEGRETKWYLYDNGTLTSVTPEKATEQLQ